MAANLNQLAVTRVYLAAFHRAPETGGLAYWTKQLDDGVSLTQVIQDIFSVDAAKAAYPDSMANEDFLKALYQNLFNKVPDPEGLHYWTGRFDDGASRAQVCNDIIYAGLGVPDGTNGKAYFLNCLEVANYAVEKQLASNMEMAPALLGDVLDAVTEDRATVTAVKAEIAQYFTDQHQDALTAVYLAILKRPPETAGLHYWTRELDGGTSLEQVINEILNVDAVKASYPATMNEGAFITSLYKNLFDKTPDRQGLDYWTGRFHDGASRAEVVSEMIDAGMAAPDGTDGKAYFVNCYQVAGNAVQQQLTTDHEIAPATLADIMTNVTADVSTVAAAIASISQLVAEEGDGAGASVPAAPANVATSPAPTAAASQALPVPPALETNVVLASTDNTHAHAVDTLIGSAVSHATDAHAEGMTDAPAAIGEPVATVGVPTLDLGMMH